MSKAEESLGERLMMRFAPWLVLCAMVLVVPLGFFSLGAIGYRAATESRVRNEAVDRGYADYTKTGEFVWLELGRDQDETSD